MCVCVCVCVCIHTHTHTKIRKYRTVGSIGPSIPAVNPFARASAVQCNDTDPKIRIGMWFEAYFKRSGAEQSAVMCVWASGDSAELTGTST